MLLVEVVCTLEVEEDMRHVQEILNVLEVLEVIEAMRWRMWWIATPLESLLILASVCLVRNRHLPSTSVCRAVFTRCRNPLQIPPLGITSLKTARVPFTYLRPTFDTYLRHLPSTLQPPDHSTQHHLPPQKLHPCRIS